MIISKQLIDILVKNHGAKSDMSDEYYRNFAADEIRAGRLTVDKVSELTSAEIAKRETSVKSMIREAMAEGPLPTKGMGTKGVNPADVFGGASFRVKSGNDSYLHTKAIGKHAKTGMPVVNEQGQECTLPSEYEAAKAGAFLKHLANRSGLQVMLRDSEKTLLEDTYQKDNWVGEYEQQWHKSLSGLQCKTLLSDSLSGGVKVNPEWFDDALITYPLLTGELLPMVDLREVPRGSAVEGGTIGNPTVTWGTASGTSIPLFDTDGFIAELNTTIHVVSVAIEVGRDFLADAAADVGRYLMEAVGQKMAAELDKVIAVGNGTSQPEGIFTASGLNAITTGGGSLAVDDVEALLFGIGKQYRQSQKCAFISNDTVYARARSIPVDASSDARRVFGMDHEAYSLLARPYKIQNDIANTKMAFGDLSRYRLYRRQGFEIQWIQEGITLARKNTAVLIVRGRFGGRVVDPSAFARATDLAS